MSEQTTQEQIVEMDINLLRTFKDHPFKVTADYPLIQLKESMPSLGTMTINALVSSDLVLILVQAAYLPVLGLQQLIRTISMVKKRLNKKLRIGGIVLTMVDKRTNYAKDIMDSVRKTYEVILPVYESVIPISIKVAESSAVGISVYTHANNCKVSDAYRELTKEVLYDEEA